MFHRWKYGNITFRSFKTNFKKHTYTRVCIYNRSFQNFIDFKHFNGDWNSLNPAGATTLNVKVKYNGIDQNTLQCCYGHYVTTNQQTELNKTYNVNQRQSNINIKLLSKKFDFKVKKFISKVKTGLFCLTFQMFFLSLKVAIFIVNSFFLNNLMRILIRGSKLLDMFCILYTESGDEKIKT